ncbi:MAG: membrane protein insertion efficiency factor YidD [Clostridia bacterium]|nr:membrane protein insertion efficiency factor YidD [Clostridia bacterium]
MKNMIINAIRFYQKNISPQKPLRCRFYPTCSQYAIEAIERLGICRGIGLAVCRLLRCTPLFSGGYDPVPDIKSKKRRKL